MARVILVFNKQVIKDYPFIKENMTIGRTDENDIVIDNLAVSGYHARIDRAGDTYILTDLQSTNGTFVNDKKIVSYRLRHKDKITIGKHLLFFALSKSEQAKAREGELDETMVLDTARQKELLAKQAGRKGIDLTGAKQKLGVVSFIDGSDQGEIELSKKLTKIGKAETSEIRLGGLFMATTAATISRRPNGYAITPTGGTKVKVNNQVIRESQILNDFDTIEIGSYKFQFYTQGSGDEK
ncbi:MAG: FHA domain-containing protein [Deltaproteobacteria bacterium]|nr:FHA domain-containing protein [Deltaproteobacteria bacterium]MBW2339055.1 FHA domain-containing protein [Deltaproteobacteria bacterium]